MPSPVFCFNIVGLSPAYLDRLVGMPGFARLMKKGKKTVMKPIFPGLTLPGQASLSTGTYPDKHGIVSNGFYYRDRFEISFWDQYHSLVQAQPVWEYIKQKDPSLKTALLFWQNTLHAEADVVVTPKPLHTEQGMIQWCYSKPQGFYEALALSIGRPFNLMDYWGPLASVKASEWIMEAAIETLRTQRPDLMMTYIPHLDYTCQRYGIDDPRIKNDLEALDGLICQFTTALEELNLFNDSTICIFSEYSLTNVNGAILVNRILRETGFLSVRTIEGKDYLDTELSRAFAMVDHQVAHIYVQHKVDVEPVKQILAGTNGIADVLSSDQQKHFNMNHRRSGELVAVSEPDKWFAYYWWSDPKNAPEFASRVDIHRKPGYDPLELFMDPATMTIPLTPELIKGSHGAPPADGKGMAAFLVSGEKASQLTLPDILPMVDVAAILKQIL